MTWAQWADGWGSSPLGAALLTQAWLKLPPRQAVNDDTGLGVSDEDLVARARRDEPGAIEQIYGRYAPDVFRRLTHLVGPDPEREDLMQEVFADLFRQLDRYRGAASLRTYLFRIASNKATDHLRQRRRRAAVDAPGLSALESEQVGTPRSGAPSPEDRVSHAQELALIERALDQLKPKKRIAFVLRVVDNLSLKEIAEQTGTTVFTVAQRLRHADRELRRLTDKARRKRP